MKKIFLVIVLTISLFSSEYIVDKEHSSIKFEASKMLFVGVDGEFTNFGGKINVENNKLTNINGLVSINSINSSDDERDEHLKANDYFFVSKFPNIKFTSKTISDKNVKASISIKGIEKELIFKVSKLSVSDKNVSFTLNSVVNRQDFMLNGSMSAIMADNVHVIAKIIANKK